MAKLFLKIGHPEVQHYGPEHSIDCLDYWHNRNANDVGHPSPPSQKIDRPAIGG
jgi:hypothetical protein